MTKLLDSKIKDESEFRTNENNVLLFLTKNINSGTTGFVYLFDSVHQTLKMVWQADKFFFLTKS